jgi:hypothetical protein
MSRRQTLLAARNLAARSGSCRYAGYHEQQTMILTAIGSDDV